MTADRKWMEQLGFELKHDGKEWLVIEDGADDRCATITEVVLWQALKVPGYLVTPIAPELDVTKILLNVVPGYEGEGLEIYAKSVDDVVALLTKQGERIEELESWVAAPVVPAGPAKFTTIEEGTAEVVRFFTEHLRRHDFTRYIKKSLAVDFCCAIAPTLHAVMASPVAPAESIGVQEAWEAAGGNPGMKASKSDLLDALGMLDKVCDEADTAPVSPASVGWPDFVRRTNEEYAAWCKITYTPDSLDNRGMPTDGGLHGLWAWQEQERRKMAAPVAPADPVGCYDGEHRDGADMVRLYSDIPNGTLLYTSPVAAPAAPAEPTHLRRADGTLSGVFVEPVASEAAAVAADLRNWLDFLPGHAQPTIEQAVRLLETRP